MTIDNSTLARQMQIWTNLYGPTRAAELVVGAQELAVAHPDWPPRQVFGAVDPDDAETYTDFVATRW